MVGLRFFVCFALLALLSISVLGSSGEVVLEGVPGNVMTPGGCGLIVTSPQGITAFIDVIYFEEKWEKALSDPKHLFAQTIKSGGGSALENDHYMNVTHCAGQKLISQTGVITSGDIRIEGISSGRFDDDIDGTNNIIIIDVAGFRIVHFGDCGQYSLTPEQLKKIGRVDLALYAIEWTYSDINLSNKKAFNVLKQVNPTIVIPTHIATSAAVRLLDKDWPAEIVDNRRFVLNSKTLAKKRSIYWGDNIPYAEKANMPRSTDL